MQKNKETGDMSDYQQAQNVKMTYTLLFIYNTLIANITLSNVDEYLLLAWSYAHMDVWLRDFHCLSCLPGSQVQGSSHGQHLKSHSDLIRMGHSQWSCPSSSMAKSSLEMHSSLFQYCDVCRFSFFCLAAVKVLLLTSSSVL